MQRSCSDRLKQAWSETHNKKTSGCNQNLQVDLSQDEINLKAIVDLIFFFIYNFTHLDSFSAVNLTVATMLNLKRRFHSRKRRLNSASSSTVGSLSDLEDRVVMLCEDFPAQNSSDSGRGSRSPEVRPGRGSQSEGHESGSEPHIIHLSRDRLSYRQACCVEREPPRAHRGFIQTCVQVYGYLFD